MTARRRARTLVGCLSLVAAAAVPVTVLAQNPPPLEPTTPTRSIQDIQRDLQEQREAIAEAVPDLASVLDEARRPAIAPKAIPPMRRTVRLLDELGAADAGAKDRAAIAALEMRAVMAILGDRGADDQIKALTVSRDRPIATAARGWSLLTRWLSARKDPAAQEKQVAELTQIARDQRDSPVIVRVASLMVETASTLLLAEQIEAVVANEMADPSAADLIKFLASRRKLRSLQDRPLEVAGTRTDGAAFTTAAWKGKVVIVDFWATWCPPCVAEMPKLRKFYAENKAKGLEVVGVCSDNDPDRLRAYLAVNPDVNWPQLFDPTKPGMHPLTTAFGVQTLPTMFVIDRKGIVRTVEGQGNYQELVTKLLAEPAE